MNQNKVAAFLALVIFGLCLSCNTEDIIYSQKKEIGLWPESQVFSFNQIQQPKQSALFMRISHSEDYSFENLYLKVTCLEQTDTLSTSVLSIDFMDEEGFWKGESKGKLRVIDYSLGALELNGGEVSELLLEQYSRENILKGIQGIEIFVKRM